MLWVVNQPSGKIILSMIFFSTTKQVIPGRGTANIVASFHPDACFLPENKSSDCVGYALGYLSLDKSELVSQPGQVIRGQAFEVPALRLDFTAFIKTALWVYMYAGFPANLEIRENLENDLPFFQSGKSLGIWEKYLKAGNIREFCQTFSPRVHTKQRIFWMIEWLWCLCRIA